MAARDAAIQERVHSLPVNHISEAPPSAESIQQLGDDDRPDDDLQRRVTHAMRKTLKAQRVCAQLVMTPRTWSVADRLLVTITPRTFRDVTQTTPGNGG